MGAAVATRLGPSGLVRAARDLRLPARLVLPPRASALLSSAYCANQGFVLGKNLGLQCHVEMTEAMIRLWNRQWADEVNGNRGPSVQSPEQMYEDLEARLAQLHGVADKLYSRWIEGLRRD